MKIFHKAKRLKSIIKYRALFINVVRSYLFFVENPEKSVWGSITEDDEKGIEHAVTHASNYEGPVVEIGALFGHTTNLLASLKRLDVPLIAVENFCWNPFYLPKDIHRQFLKRTIRYAIDHCATQIFEGDAAAFYSAKANLQPSLVFIDAGHDYESVKRDIYWALSTGCPVISGHDYTDIHPGVIKAVHESFGDNISVYGSVWIHTSPKGEQVSRTDA
jgi:hypothetical protein